MKRIGHLLHGARLADLPNTIEAYLGEGDKPGRNRAYQRSFFFFTAVDEAMSEVHKADDAQRRQRPCREYLKALV